MATRQSAKRTLTGAVAAIARFVVVSLFTGVGTVALGIWLAFALDAPILSRAAAIGLGILVVGLIIEHVLTDLAANGFDLSFPAGRVVVISVSEAALWAVWLVIAERIGGIEGVAVAGVALAVLFVPSTRSRTTSFGGAACSHGSSIRERSGSASSKPPVPPRGSRS